MVVLDIVGFAFSGKSQRVFMFICLNYVVKGCLTLANVGQSPLLVICCQSYLIISGDCFRLLTQLWPGNFDDDPPVCRM